MLSKSVDDVNNENDKCYVKNGVLYLLNENSYRVRNFEYFQIDKLNGYWFKLTT